FLGRLVVDVAPVGEHPALRRFGHPPDHAGSALHHGGGVLLPVRGAPSHEHARCDLSTARGGGADARGGRMIEGGWTFVWSAYAVAAAGLGALVVIALARFLHWRKAARA